MTISTYDTIDAEKLSHYTVSGQALAAVQRACENGEHNQSGYVPRYTVIVHLPL